MDMETYVDTMAQAIGLPLSPDHRPGVLMYMRLVAAMAPRVMDFSLGPVDEPATVFRPEAAGDVVPQAQ
jgi:hypothetical protein